MHGDEGPTRGLLGNSSCTTKILGLSQKQHDKGSPQHPMLTWPPNAHSARVHIQLPGMLAANTR